MIYILPAEFLENQPRWASGWMRSNSLTFRRFREWRLLHISRLRVNGEGRALTHLVRTEDSSRRPVRLLSYAFFRFRFFDLVLVLQLYPSQCGPRLIFYIIALHK